MFPISFTRNQLSWKCISLVSGGGHYSKRMAGRWLYTYAAAGAGGVAAVIKSLPSPNANVP